MYWWVVLEGGVASEEEQLRHGSVDGVAECDGPCVFPRGGRRGFGQQDCDVWKVGSGAVAFVDRIAQRPNELGSSVAV